MIKLKDPGKRKKPESITKGLNVRRKRCKHCLFGKEPLLPKILINGKIDSCLIADKTFHCHEFDNVTCKGFFDSHAKEVIPTRIALALDAIVWVD